MAVKLISLNPRLFQNTETGETSDNPVDIGGTIDDLRQLQENGIDGILSAFSGPTDSTILQQDFINANAPEIVQNDTLINKTVDLEPSISSGGKEVPKNGSGKAVNSIFDKEGFNGFASQDLDGGTKDNPNKYLNKSSKYAQQDSTGFTNPTATNIVQRFGTGKGSSASYTWDYPDLIFCKNYGKISNNYLITLRRFAMPPPDDIIDINSIFIKEDGSVQSENLNQPPISQACTFLGEEAGNALKDIFKFKVGFNYQKIEGELSKINRNETSTGGGIFSGSLLGKYKGTSKGRVVSASVFGKDPIAQRQAELDAGRDLFAETYPNHIFGPLNVIKDMMIQQRGINFEQSFTLNFEYELRSFDGLDGREAFLNLMSELLLLTYAKASFWGGDVRYYGNGYVGSPLLSDKGINAFRNGEYRKFIGDIGSNATNLLKGALSGLDLNEKSDLVDIIGKGIGSLLKNFSLDRLNELFRDSRQTQAIAAELTGEPTGFWHLTIGNPFQPTMVIGNLILEDAEFEFDGPLSFNDMPTKLKVTVNLKHGRGRDKGEIERMFNFGKAPLLHPLTDDAIYSGQSPKITPYSNRKLHVKKYAT